MRTTLSLDDDVAALIRSEREQTGESFKDTVNRLLRRSVRTAPTAGSPRLPSLPGGPILDVSDASVLLAALDDERRAQRGIT